MSDPKNRWLILLLCINVILITAIVASHVGIPHAYGQVRAYDYIITPGRNGYESEALWIIDMRNQQLATCIFNPLFNRIDFGSVVDISMFPTILNEPSAPAPADLNR